MFDYIQKPSIDHPIVFLGWGGPRSTDAIFSVCPEYIGDRTVALIFDEKKLAEHNHDVQLSVGSGFSIERIIPESPDGKYGIIFMKTDPSAIKETIFIGQEDRLVKEIGCEYAIAFYCCGEFDLIIGAFDKDNKWEELYTRSFCCK